MQRRAGKVARNQASGSGAERGEEFANFRFDFTGIVHGLRDFIAEEFVEALLGAQAEAAEAA